MRDSRDAAVLMDIRSTRRCRFLFLNGGVDDDLDFKADTRQRLKRIRDGAEVLSLHPAAVELVACGDRETSVVGQIPRLERAQPHVVGAFSYALTEYVERVIPKGMDLCLHT